MSWQAVAAVLAADFPDLPPTAARRYGVTQTVLKFVCVTLAESANADGTDARDGIRRIAQRAAVTTDTARIALAGLVELGAIRLTRAATGSDPARYDVVLDALPGLCTTPVSARATRAFGVRATRAQRAGHPRESARATRAISSTSPVTPAPRPDLSVAVTAAHAAVAQAALRGIWQTLAERGAPIPNRAVGL
jgi:hypothetical protein